MGKLHFYKGKIIENVPYKSLQRWFIYNEDGTEDDKYKCPKSSLKEAKECIDFFKDE